MIREIVRRNYHGEKGFAAFSYNLGNQIHSLSVVETFYSPHDELQAPMDANVNPLQERDNITPHGLLPKARQQTM